MNICICDDGLSSLVISLCIIAYNCFDQLPFCLFNINLRLVFHEISGNINDIANLN